jgi:hypothetical protein
MLGKLSSFLTFLPSPPSFLWPAFVLVGSVAGAACLVGTAPNYATGSTAATKHARRPLYELLMMALTGVKNLIEAATPRTQQDFKLNAYEKRLVLMGVHRGGMLCAIRGTVFMLYHSNETCLKLLQSPASLLAMFEACLRHSAASRKKSPL